MANISSYTDYLPSVLWSQENDPSQFLGRALCIFEKILTGIPDGIPIIHCINEHVNFKKTLAGVPDSFSIDNCIHEPVNHEHDNFEKTINELHHIFNPWHTDTDFLCWLASWVALTFQKDWSEYQKRKFISEIVSIYQERGLKNGLYSYLDIYTTNEKAKPRIAIDDGDSIFRATFMDDGTAVLHTVAHSIAISQKDSLIMTALLHPSAIAADNNNDYIVADQGNTSLSQSLQPSLWKVSSTGEIEYKSIPNIQIPMPHPIHSGSPLVNPIAIVIDKQNRYSVLDIGEINDDNSLESAIYRFDPHNPDIEIVIKKPAVHPVDMILDNSGNFIVLDRGKHPTRADPPSGSGPANPKIVVVSEGPPVEHPLEKVIEPTALAMNSRGLFIVADAKKQSSSDPADLVMVDPNTWSETPLLDIVPPDKNPLIFPTGLAFEGSQTLLVCDTGVKWEFRDEKDNRVMAEPAAIYRIKNLPQTPPSSALPRTQPTITRVTYERKLVNPTKIMIDRKGNLIIADQGEYQRETGGFPQREWRAKANEFGITVVFSQKRQTSEEDRKRIRREITNIVNEQKPGHTSWWMKFY